VLVLVCECGDWIGLVFGFGIEIGLEKNATRFAPRNAPSAPLLSRFSLACHPIFRVFVPLPRSSVSVPFAPTIVVIFRFL